MKKLLFILLAGFINALLAVPDNAVDFTSKDTKGVEHHLFAYLDAEKYVMIEFIIAG